MIITTAIEILTKYFFELFSNVSAISGCRLFGFRQLLKRKMAVNGRTRHQSKDSGET
jgi:hypothetical protein